MSKFKISNKFKKKREQISTRDKKSADSYLFEDDQDESRVFEKGLGDWKSLLVLLTYAKGFYFKIFISLFLIFASSLFALLSSKYMGDLIEKGLIQKSLKHSLNYSLVILLLEAFSICLIWQGRKYLSANSSLIIFNVRKRLFLKLNELPLSFLDRQPLGRIVTRITHDVEGIDEFFTSSLGNLLSALIMTFLALGAMLVTNFKLGIVMVASIIPSIFLMFITKNFLRDSNRKVSKFSSAINVKLSEFLNGIEVIHSLGLEEWSKKKFDISVDDYLDAQLKGNFLFSWSMPLVTFFASLPLIGLVWYGGRGVLNGAFSVGVFIAFIRYYERFFNPLMLLSREIHVVQQAFSSTERVMSFINEDDEAKTFISTGDVSFTSLEGDIRFEDVSMAYNDDRLVLRNLTFHISPGEKIGLVGKTGCGKSSTVSLLSRLYEFQSGEIFIDGIPIRNFNRNKLRNHIGFVSQDAIIFKGSLRDNLTCKLGQSDLDLLDASKETGLIRAFNREGFTLDMEILESGTNLSVGQRQLISLTRVLLNNPSILVLDEATANIDPFYEKIIHDAVMKIMKGRSCLIIAHRLETLKECDRIFVFNDGQLVEEGSLNKLLEKGEYFHRLHSAQSLH